MLNIWICLDWCARVSFKRVRFVWETIVNVCVVVCWSFTHLRCEPYTLALKPSFQHQGMHSIFVNTELTHNTRAVLDFCSCASLLISLCEISRKIIWGFSISLARYRVTLMNEKRMWPVITLDTGSVRSNVATACSGIQGQCLNIQRCNCAEEDFRYQCLSTLMLCDPYLWVLNAGIVLEHQIPTKEHGLSNASTTYKTKSEERVNSTTSLW